MRERANRDRIEVCARGANETKRIAAKRDGTVRYGTEWDELLLSRFAGTMEA